MKFKSRPQVVEAVQWVGDENCEEVFAFLGWEHPDDEEDHSLIYVSVYPNGVLETVPNEAVLNDTVEVVPGCWFTKDDQGRVRVYKAEVFEAEFEAVLGETRTDMFVNGVDCHVKVTDLATGKFVELHGGYPEQHKLVEQAKVHLREMLVRGE